MSYYFYKTINLIDNKFYYGSGTFNNYLGSGVYLNNAIKKYGKENFVLQKLKFFKTRKEAYDFEDRFLKLYRISSLKESYNLKDSSLGSDGTNSGEKNGMYGKVACITEDGDTIVVNKDDHRILSGELMRANVGYKFTNAQKQKLSQSLKKSKKFRTALQSPERRKKISDSVKGCKNGMYGKTHTEESKKKMSFAGANNPRAKQVNICDLYNTVLFVFDTINAAALHLSINRNTLKYYINNSKILNNKYRVCFAD